MNWSVEQQRFLGAMGYELMVRASLPAALPPVAATPPSTPAGLDGEGSGLESFPQLLQALRRAAGDRDVSGLIADVERLRREPALKRALWPQLRALRRNH